MTMGALKGVHEFDLGLDKLKNWITFDQVMLGQIHVLRGLNK